jgi:hypothetical protein
MVTKIRYKKCVCGNAFVPARAIQKFCSPRCEIKHKSGKGEVTVNSSLSELMDKATGLFSQFIKQRDAGKPCISCGAKPTKEHSFQCGHYLPAGQYSGVEFDEDNAAAQCVNCNCMLYGNTAEYRKNLLTRIGLVKVAQLEERAHMTKFCKRGKVELVEIITKYRGK